MFSMIRSLNKLRIIRVAKETKLSLTSTVSSSDTVKYGEKPLSETRPAKTLKEAYAKHSILWSWILGNLHDPKPSDELMKTLSLVSGMPVTWVQNWIEATTEHDIEVDKKSGVYKLVDNTLQQMGAEDTNAAKRLFMPWDELQGKLSDVMALKDSEKKIIMNEIDELNKAFCKEEYTCMKLKGIPVVENLTAKHLQRLLLETNFMNRASLHLLFHKYETKKELERKLKKANAASLEPNEDYVPDGLNRISLSPNKKAENLAKENHLYQAVIHGPHLVFDASLSDFMRHREAIRVASQIHKGFVFNRDLREPFHFHITNLKETESIYTMLYEHKTGSFVHDTVGVSMTPESFMTFYSPRELVYLSPDSPNVLENYNPNHTYIVGALVDKPVLPNATRNIAEKLGIKTARFPIREYVKWNTGAHMNLTLCQVVEIMCKLKAGCSWGSILYEALPSRKIMPPHRSKSNRML